MTYNSKKNKKGFTLVETMVAITILLVAVVGPMSYIGNSVSQIYYSRDQIIASNLAMEGIEGVRQIRDSNLLQRWIDGTTGSGYSPPSNPKYHDNIYGPPACHAQDCIIEMSSVPPVLSVCNGACTGVLNQNASGFFTHNAGTPTKFTRLLRVNTVNSDEFQIISTVTWQTSGGATKTVVLSENLFGIND